MISKRQDKVERSYDICIKEKGDSFHLLINELSIIGKGRTLDDAYNNLMEKKGNLVREYEELEMLDDLPRPSFKGISERSELIGEFLSFFVKVLMVVVMVGVVGAFVVRVGTKDLERQGDKIRDAVLQVGPAVEKAALVVEKVGHDIEGKSSFRVGRYLEKELKKGAEKKFSPERQDALINNIRILVQRYKPVFDEIAPLFSGEASELEKGEVNIIP